MVRSREQVNSAGLWRRAHYQDLRSMETPLSGVTDVAIAGGGAVGLCLALAIRSASGGRLGVSVIDPRGEPHGLGPRTSAIARGPRTMLERFGVWRELAPNAQPIWSMNIGEGDPADVVRPVALTFASEDPEPLAHMVFHRDLEPLLYAAAVGAGARMVTDRVVGAEAGTASTRLTMQSGEQIKSRLLVGADGVGSRLRIAARIPALSWAYERTAIVATVHHAHDHEGVATQYFFPNGPFAILPVRGRRSSIVWTETPDRARWLCGLDKQDFTAELAARMGHLGSLSLEEGPATFPLVFQMARRFVAPRLALVGDSAHRVHPLAGQGLNIGFRDVALLAELIIRQARLGLDIGSEATLSAYDSGRRFDAFASASTFDLLHRVFNVPGRPARAIRGAGLAINEHISALKLLLQREAAGLAGSPPQFFRASP